MQNQHAVILGGYGTTGKLIARLMLSETSVSITLAGRNLDKARQAAEVFNAEHPGVRVRAAYADASDPQSLELVFGDADIVISAASTAAYSENIARAALRAKIDYIDLQYSTEKIRLLESMRAEIENEGLCFITDGGFHPGLPAALVRFSAQYFERIEKANVGSVIKIDWKKLALSPETMQEFIRELLDFQTLHFKDSRWQKISILRMIIPKYVDYGKEFGRQYCFPMFLEEMRPLPEEYPSLTETGFYVGGFNWFVDWFLSPIIFLGAKLSPKKGLEPSAGLLLWGLQNFSRPPYGTLLKLEASGTANNLPKTVEITISHPDGYLLTAIPVVACLMQYLSGEIRKPGLWFQAHIVEPNQFFKDMQRLGVQIQTTHIHEA